MDSFFSVLIKAVVKWPFCLLPQRLVFQYPEQMVCVFHGWITEPGGFCLASLDYVKLVCVSSSLTFENTPVSKLYIYCIYERLWIHWFPVFFSPQTLEEPPYLTVGTDVSAKYRGAFCEAKIKTAKRLVKAKVSHISKCSWSKIKNLLSVCVACEGKCSRARGLCRCMKRIHSGSHSSGLLYIQRRLDWIFWWFLWRLVCLDD